MNTLAKLTLALGVIIVTALPASIQAYEPPHRGFYSHHQGLRITSVGFRSPAAHAGLERGDVILEVDGRDVRTYDQLHDSLHQTGYRGVMTVRDVRTGRIRVMQVFPSNGHIGVTVAPAVYR